MFQYGKVLRIFKPEDKEVDSSDKSVQAQIEMWDEIVIIAAVASNLSDKIKIGDFVVTDVNQISQNLFRHVIVKIVKGKQGLDAFMEFKKVFNKKRQEAESQQFDLDIPKGKMIR